jgi:leucyl/phenylalanyl-tRNA--protein transferase
VGGLYGISIGSMFFGESMFASKPDASKIALYHLCQYMIAKDMDLIDCQIPNDHLLSLGAQILPRDEFYPFLEESVNKNTHSGPWIYQSS